MKKIRWKRFAALALAVMLFAGAVPVAAPVQAYASEVSVYSDKIQRGKTGKSMTLSFTIRTQAEVRSKTQRLPLTPVAAKSGMRTRKTVSMAIPFHLR